MTKAALRARAKALRVGCDPDRGGESVAWHALRELPLPKGATIAGVWPLEGEMDLRPLIFALHSKSFPIVLPETTPLGAPLIFRRWEPGCPMIRERFGTWRPDGEVAVPDVVFVPLLAFDRTGNRLGYGGGYYDRTLAALPGRPAYGFGYAAQEMENIPWEPHDRRLDAVVTEHGVIHITTTKPRVG